MLLDFFATFFASAMALLPIFAQDILHVGAQGYGLLSAAPAAGALVASARHAAADRPPRAAAGAMLLWAVVVLRAGDRRVRAFALVLAGVACLALSGATDTVSTIIRNLVRQLETPDAMRGRMIGVNMVFFQGGPQLGELEAGLGRPSGWAPRRRSSPAASGASSRRRSSRRSRPMICALSRGGVAVTAVRLFRQLHLERERFDRRHLIGSQA